VIKTTVLSKKSVSYILAAFICATLALTVISVVLARPFRVGRLPDKGKNFGCGTCHVNPRGGGKRNPFGQDYEKVGIKARDRYTEKLGELDSDGDGFTNDQEFAAGTRPGDSKSKPAGGAAPQVELTKAIEKGEALFNDTKLGKTGTSCNSCHPGGDTSGGQVMGMEIPALKGAAATFPKYKKQVKRVITLSQMNNVCIEMVMEGKPLKLGSDKAVALAAYVTSLSNGVKVQVGEK
jgi:cytochrome c peroxidase